jgi:pyruvate/2-oxoglutarate/acetoin dehydrogenase E1 component
VTVQPQDRELTYIQAVNEALRWALRELPDTLIFGEDVAKPGGPFGASRGLYAEFGAGRIFDTPISESAILGAAVGASMRGLRPIVEIMFMDFSLVALDQIVNQAANIRYVSNGAFNAPLTIRTQQGATPGSCAQHSQCLEAFFAHTPGLRIAAPATAQDAYDLLRTAIAADDPTLVIESRALYRENGRVALDTQAAPIDGPRIVREGSDLTVVTWSRMVHEAHAAAEELAQRGVSTEIIDLRWIAPLRIPVILESLAKTGRLIVAHEANLTGGFGAEIVARICSDGFDLLDAPAQRVAARDLRMPASPTLQSSVLPTLADIVAAADSLASF